MDNMAEETKEEVAAQESPTVENDQQVEGTQQNETETETPQERNWKAIREELDAIKAENAKLKSQEASPLSGSRSDLDNIYLTPDENLQLGKEEVKAELKFPELETKNIFSMAVLGEYRKSLDEYQLKKSLGMKTELPSVFSIAKRVKAEYDSSFGELRKNAELEGAKKAQQAVEKKEATVDVETRSDRAKAITSSEEINLLRRRSREGDNNAVAERLAKSNL